MNRTAPTLAALALVLLAPVARAEPPATRPVGDIDTIPVEGTTRPTRPALDPAAGEPTHPAPGLTSFTVTQEDFPLRAFALKIDLTNPAVRVEMAWSGPDPDGPDGEWETVLKPTSEVARREGFAAAVNAGYFRVPSKPTADYALGTTQKVTGYVDGVPARNVGFHAEEGVVQGQPWGAELVIKQDGTAEIGKWTTLPGDTREAISGSQVILWNGRTTPEAERDKPRHPRTAVGTADGGKTLFLLVADGRRPGWSDGLTLVELAAVMKQIGATDALNLDGGGSTTMILPDAADGTRPGEVVNRPSDGSMLPGHFVSRERPVADVLGVRITPTTPRPATRPAGE